MFDRIAAELFPRFLERRIPSGVRSMARWDELDRTLARRCREIVADDPLIERMEPIAALGFAVDLVDGTEVSFDWDDGNGAQFLVIFRGGRRYRVDLDRGARFARTLEWLEFLFDFPIEVVLHAVQIARQRRPREGRAIRTSNPHLQAFVLPRFGVTAEDVRSSTGAVGLR